MANRFVLNETSYHGKGAITAIVDEATGIQVVKDEDPEQCVARGLARVINEREFRSLTFRTKEQEYH